MSVHPPLLLRYFHSLLTLCSPQPSLLSPLRFLEYPEKQCNRSHPDPVRVLLLFNPPCNPPSGETALALPHSLVATDLTYHILIVTR
jgi:hypothetical protein